MNRNEILKTVGSMISGSRQREHGDASAQFTAAQMLKDILRRAPHWNVLTLKEREAIEMVCTKLSRKVHGDPTSPDHLIDLIGYATLGAEGDATTVERVGHVKGRVLTANDVKQLASPTIDPNKPPKPKPGFQSILHPSRGWYYRKRPSKAARAASSRRAKAMHRVRATKRSKPSKGKRRG